ncbi:hypothetical protein E5288_WYG002926 [Bos mutus]|uniref:Uncharacterized protein n=1 Tax=Bos mutus TaxID=72004 RepID=A0A6B0S8M5_9CETA|nr:hypothetical protein [Bos mutus]
MILLHSPGRHRPPRLRDDAEQVPTPMHSRYQASEEGIDLIGYDIELSKEYLNTCYTMDIIPGIQQLTDSLINATNISTWKTLNTFCQKIRESMKDLTVQKGRKRPFITIVQGPPYYPNGSQMSGTRAVDTHLTAEEGSTDIWSCKDARKKVD